MKKFSEILKNNGVEIDGDRVEFKGNKCTCKIEGIIFCHNPSHHSFILSGHYSRSFINLVNSLDEFIDQLEK